MLNRLVDSSETVSIEETKATVEKLKKKYPNTIPIFITKAPRSTVPEINKNKYIVPDDLTVGQFLFILRKRLNMPPEKAIFIYYKNILPPTGEKMGDLYNKYKHEDSMLYLTYCGENCFGDVCLI
jgi:GABA(A) receptor-associated protein